MLAVDAPVSAMCCSANALKFWHLRITKNFPLPKYYIGQAVFHVMKVKQGEILHPVTIIGIGWNRTGWDYEVELPSDHPDLNLDDLEYSWLSENEIEPI